MHIYFERLRMRGGRFARLSLNFEDIPYKMLKYRDFVASLNVLMIQKFATDPPPPFLDANQKITNYA